MIEKKNELPPIYENWTHMYKAALRSKDVPNPFPASVQVSYHNQANGELFFYEVFTDFLKARVFDEMQENLDMDLHAVVTCYGKATFFGERDEVLLKKVMNLAKLSPKNNGR